MKKSTRIFAAIGLLALSAVSAYAADPYVNVTVGGVLRPGVYGVIQVGNAPAPPVVNAQPVIITQPVVVGAIPAQPVYLYAPKGHQKKWAKHCHKYNACGQPVYFVNMAQYQGGQPLAMAAPGRGHKHDHDRGEEHGKGHGKKHREGKDKH